MAGLTFGEKLADLRVKKGLKQKELGEQIGVNERTISSYETNDAKPHYDKIVKLVELFHVSYDYLMGTEAYDEVTTVDFATPYTQVNGTTYTEGDVHKLLHFFAEEKKPLVISCMQIILRNPKLDVETIIQAMQHILDVGERE